MILGATAVPRAMIRRTATEEQKMAEKRWRKTKAEKEHRKSRTGTFADGGGARTNQLQAIQGTSRGLKIRGAIEAASFRPSSAVMLTSIPLF